MYQDGKEALGLYSSQIRSRRFQNDDTGELNLHFVRMKNGQYRYYHIAAKAEKGNIAAHIQQDWIICAYTLGRGRDIIFCLHVVC